MFNEPPNVSDAAKKLAHELQLPSNKGSVFAWIDKEEMCIVVAADLTWLKTNLITIPSFYHGYEVHLVPKIQGTFLTDVPASTQLPPQFSSD